MVSADATDVNNLFTYVAAILVFLMQAGFAIMEHGISQPKNRTSSLLRAALDVCIVGLAWWVLGYLLSIGVNTSSRDDHGFLGTSDGSRTYAFSKVSSPPSTAD